MAQISAERSPEIQAAVTRLFTLMGIDVPHFGTLTLEFAGGRLEVARQTVTVRVAHRSQVVGREPKKG